IMFLWFVLRKESYKLVLSRKMYGIYLLLALFTMFFNATGYLISCTYLSVPQALIIHYTFPLVTMIGGVFVTSEKPSVSQYIGSIMVLMGLYIGFMFGTTASNVRISTMGLAWGILSVLGLSGQTLISRKISLTGLSDPLVQLFYVHCFGGLLLIIGKSVLLGWEDLVHLTPAIFFVMQYPAIVSGLIAFGLLFASLKYIPASIASMLCTLEILFALLLTPILLHQIPTFYEIIACGIILFAVLYSTWKPKKLSRI
ncbi:MAG: DMT family transporter, partial [Cloacibacillus sp.]